MNDRLQKKESIEPIIVDWLTKTLLPVLSWYVSRLFSAFTGCNLTVVLLHPTTKYKDQLVRTLLEITDFSCAEIVSFKRASGRRRGRKKFRKLLRPLIREIEKSQECLLLRRLLQEKLCRLKETLNDEIQYKIPSKARIEYDIARQDTRNHEWLIAYSQDDILEAFPMGSTLSDGNLRKRIASEVDGYPETMHSLLWEASQDWNLIRQVRIRGDSEFWKILGFDPNDEPHLEALMDWSLDLVFGQVNEDKLMYLSRWFMDRIFVSQFILHPYSDKRFDSLQKRVADGLTLEDVIPDDTPSNLYNPQTELSAEQGREAIVYSLAAIGIGRDDLTAKEWDEIFERHDLMRKGYEFSSKTGMSIKSFYGEQAHAKEQKWSRIKKKIRGLSNKPH